MAIKFIRKTTSGGRKIFVRKLKKTRKPACRLCSAALHGVARGTPLELCKLGKSERAPSRPFAGVLCSRCARDVVVLKTLVRNKFKKKDEIPISLRGYVYG